MPNAFHILTETGDYIIDEAGRAHILQEEATVLEHDTDVMSSYINSSARFYKIPFWQRVRISEIRGKL